MSFESTSRREESLIPNTQIETMFLRICDDDQMKNYVKFVDEGHVSLATAYASNIVSKLFYRLVDSYEKLGGSIELLNHQTKKAVNK